MLLGCSAAGTSDVQPNVPQKNAQLKVDIIDSNGDPVKGRMVYFEISPGRIRDSVHNGSFLVPQLFPGRYSICVAWKNEFLTVTRRCDSVTAEIGDTPVSLVIDAVKPDGAMIPREGQDPADTLTTVKIVMPNY